MATEYYKIDKIKELGSSGILAKLEASADAAFRSDEGIATHALNGNGVFDPLKYLPLGRLIEFDKNELIFGVGEDGTQVAQEGLYAVISGRVKLVRLQPWENEPDMLMGLYREEQFFGEQGFRTGPAPKDSAFAVTESRVMVWNFDSLKEVAAKHPGFWLWVAQLALSRSEEYAERVESMGHNTIPVRMVRALFLLARTLGEPGEPIEVRGVRHETIEVKGVTHKFLSQYVGSSRELITANLNSFRRSKHLVYDRQSITLHKSKLEKYLRETQ